MDDDKNKGIIKSTEEEEEIEEEETEEKDKKMSTTTVSPPTAASSSQENPNPENTAATTPRVTRNNKRLHHQQQKNVTDSPKASNDSINKTKSEEKAEKIKRDLQTSFSSSSVLDAEKEKNDEKSEPEVLGLENKKITDDDVSGSTISKNPKREREKTILEPRGEKAVPEKSSFLRKTRSSRLSNQPRGSSTTSNIPAVGAKQQSKNNESTENGKTLKTTTKKKKKSKPYTTSNRRSKRLYDEAGALLSNGKDYCDCLETDCPGCHFPCKKCGSEKCGTECRCDRAWVYDEVKVEGTGIVVKNHAC